jgi:chromosomal replication initiation ATPase DnaA
MRDTAQIVATLAAAFSEPPSRPLALRGPSGSGKTTLLRGVSRQAQRQAVWLTAFDLVHELTAAIREDRYSGYSDTLAADQRPLCIEHLEDLRDKPQTRAIVQRLLERAAHRRPVLLTLTSSSRDAEVARWLGSWTELLSLEPLTPAKPRPSTTR